MGSQIIHASNGTQLARAVQEEGYGLRKVVFKTTDAEKRKYGKRGGLPHSLFSDRGDDLEEQYVQLMRLRRVSENIVEPLALVVAKGEVVGYLMRRAPGTTLSSVWNTAVSGSASQKERRRAAELFVHAAFEVIDTLEQILSRGLAHGDPAGRNTMVSAHGRVALIDPRIDDSSRREDKLHIKDLSDDIATLGLMLRS